MKKILIPVLAVTVIILSVFAVKGLNTVLYPVKYEELILTASEKYDLPPSLLFAMVKTESGFDPNAVSSASAVGLTQITKDTFDWLLTKTGEEYTFNDLFTPEVSIKYGAMFLNILITEYKNTDTAVAAYHAGMGNVDSWLKDPAFSNDGVSLHTIPIDDTAHYVNKITKAKLKYEKLYNY